MSDIYNIIDYTHGTHRCYLRLELPFKNTFSGQNGLSFVGPRLWNDLSFDLKVCDGPNTFKHKVKAVFFQKAKKEVR